MRVVRHLERCPFFPCFYRVCSAGEEREGGGGMEREREAQREEKRGSGRGRERETWRLMHLTGSGAKMCKD